MKDCNYEHKALIYAERYGIIDYKVEDRFIVWEESYQNEGKFIHRIDLNKY